MIRYLLVFFCFTFVTIEMVAGKTFTVRHYDRNDGLSEHVYALRQDKWGVIWISTYGGLYSFDGQQFAAHKNLNVSPPVAGYHWRPNSSLENEVVAEAKNIFDDKDRILCSLSDRNGILWIGTTSGLWKVTKNRNPFHHIEFNEEVLCLFRSSKGELWMSTREGTVCILDQELTPVRYLNNKGEWSKEKTFFGMVVMNMMETSDGGLLLSARRDGLVRLQPSSSSMSIIRIQGNSEREGGLRTLRNVYATCIDIHGRVWTASLQSGLGMITQLSPSMPHEIINFNTLLTWEKRDSISNRFRCFLPVYADDWLIGSDNGLYYVKPSTWRSNKTGLIKILPWQTTNNSENTPAILTILSEHDGKIIAGTSGQGLMVYDHQTEIANLRVSRVLTKERDNLPSDVIYALAEDSKNKVWGFCDTGVFFITKDYANKLSDGRPKCSVANISNNHSFALPDLTIGNALQLKDGRILKGTKKGLLWFNADSIGTSQAKFPIFMEASYRKEKSDTAFAIKDTLLLPNGVRNFSLYCSLLDYNRMSDVVYAYRIENSDTVWTYTSNPVMEFDKLPSGYSEIVVRATNGDGVWSGSERHFTVYVEHTIPWFALYCAAFVILVAIIIFTYQRKLEKKKTEAGLPNVLKPILEDIPTQDAVDEQFKNDVIAQIKRHLDDSLFSPDALAQEMGLSRSMFLSKVKKGFGTVPVDVINRVRIHAATELLTNTELTISEIAYRVGFNDPKYFSRVYKKNAGVSPSEIRKKEKKEKN